MANLKSAWSRRVKTEEWYSRSEGAARSAESSICGLSLHQKNGSTHKGCDDGGASS